MPFRSKIDLAAMYARMAAVITRATNNSAVWTVLVP